MTYFLILYKGTPHLNTDYNTLHERGTGAGVRVNKEHVAHGLTAIDLEIVNMRYFETHMQIAKRRGPWKMPIAWETMYCSKFPKGAAISHYSVYFWANLISALIRSLFKRELTNKLSFLH